MAQVVMARHGKAPLRQIRCQGLVPQDVLRHAVGNLPAPPGAPSPASSPPRGCRSYRPRRERQIRFVPWKNHPLCAILCAIRLRMSALRLDDTTLPLQTPEEVTILWKLMSSPWTRAPPAPGPFCSTGPGRSSARGPAPLPPDLPPARLGGARPHGDLGHGAAGPGGGRGQPPTSTPSRSPPSASPTSGRPPSCGTSPPGEPVYNAIVWQCRRTAALCDELKAQGLGRAGRQSRRGF